MRDPGDGRLSLSGRAEGPVRESLHYLARADLGLDALEETLPIAKSSGALSVKGDLSLSLAQPPRFAPDFELSLTLNDLLVRDFLGEHVGH